MTTMAHPEGQLWSTFMISSMLAKQIISMVDKIACDEIHYYSWKYKQNILKFFEIWIILIKF